MSAKAVAIMAFGLALIGLAAVVVFGREDGAIWPFKSRSIADRCQPENGLFGNFEAKRPRVEAPDESFADGEGRERRIRDFQGKGVVLNFWATWCAPCVKEMPALDRLSAMTGSNAIHVAALSSDREGAAVVKAFYQKNGIKNLAVLVDPKSKLVMKSGAKGLPTTLLIDPAGREVGRVVGPAEWDSGPVAAFLRGCLQG